jgi:tetratricopeptide (TPR) repeat protein
MRAVAFAALATLALLRPARVFGQSHEHTPASRGTTTLRIGTVRFASSGAAAAQPAFLSGLALLHNFEYPRAAQAFREAQRLDPGFAMAYWGEAMAYNHGIWREQDSTTARAVLARLGPTLAERLARAPTAREKDYLGTLDVLFDSAGTKAGRDSAYARAAEQLARRYPDDQDAQLFHSLALMSLFPRTDSTYKRAGAIAERVLAAYPTHPGALHYVIHAYDDPAHAKRALPAARAYGQVAPDAPHAMHMTSHIFIALGMWDDVVAANEAASPDARKFGVGAPPACYHAGIWLQYAYLQQGRLTDARRMVEACRDAAVRTPRAAAGFAQMRLTYLIETDDPSREAESAPAVLALTIAGNGAGSSSPMLTGAEAHGSAYIALRHGDTLAARPFVQRVHELRVSFGTTEMGRMVPEMASAWNVADDELRALSLLRSGKGSEAVAVLSRATAEEDAMPFAFGPPAVDKPSHELLGEVLLALGRPAEARAEFERAIARTPGRSLTLLGLARARRAAGDTSAAADLYRRLLSSNWHRADAGLPGVREARTALSRPSLFRH